MRNVNINLARNKTSFTQFSEINAIFQRGNRDRKNKEFSLSNLYYKLSCFPEKLINNIPWN